MIPALAIAAVAVRRRRAVLGLIGAALSTCWMTLMGVLVLTMGGTPPPAELDTGVGMPATVLDAYQRATQTPQGAACGMRWQILAGVGRVESNNANGRTIHPDGTITPSIIGPVLNGSDGTARVSDTDGGTLDRDTAFDHAVGPMQFLPSSWSVFGADANNDTVADPNNIYDAAAGVVAHLCHGLSGPLSNDSVLGVALFAYNHSDTYLSSAMQWVHYYDQATTTRGPQPPAPSSTPRR